MGENTMKTQKIQKQFKRREVKFIIDKESFALFEQELSHYMVEDQFAKSTISNVYFDNDDFDMIQDAIAKKNGREKVRMRVYDQQPSFQSQAFLEIKKKVEGVGYKYRLTSTPIAISNYIEHFSDHSNVLDAQISAELQSLTKRYGKLSPKMYIYYDRSSYRGRDDRKLRLTIDQNLVYRDVEVPLLHQKYGYPLLPHHLMIMEIKIQDAMPHWLQDLLDKYHLEQQSFSKYGTAYRLNQEMVKGAAFANRVI